MNLNITDFCFKQRNSGIESFDFDLENKVTLSDNVQGEDNTQKNIFIMEESDFGLHTLDSQMDQILQNTVPEAKDLGDDDFESKLQRLKIKCDSEDHEERYASILQKLHTLRMNSALENKPLSASSVNDIQLCLSKVDFETDSISLCKQLLSIVQAASLN